MFPHDGPIPVYIGISKRFKCCEGLTERSILRNTTADVKITHLYPEIEEGCTGFSKVRWTIERGIYLDCDMIVLGDISELWEYRRTGKYVCMSDGSTEVAVIDGKARLPLIPLEWNVEDKVTEGMKLLHFTDLNTQPWFYDHPNREAVEVWNNYK